MQSSCRPSLLTLSLWHHGHIPGTARFPTMAMTEKTMATIATRGIIITPIINAVDPMNIRVEAIPNRREAKPTGVIWLFLTRPRPKDPDRDSKGGHSKIWNNNADNWRKIWSACDGPLTESGDGSLWNMVADGENLVMEWRRRCRVSTKDRKSKKKQLRVIFHSQIQSMITVWLKITEKQKQFCNYTAKSGTHRGKRTFQWSLDHWGFSIHLIPRTVELVPGTYTIWTNYAPIICKILKLTIWYERNQERSQPNMQALVPK